MNFKLIGLGGFILIALVAMACGSGDDNAKTAGPTATQTSSSNSGGNTSAATHTVQATATQAGASSAAGADACALLTTDEVAAATKDTVDAGIQTQNAAESTSECNWNSTNLVTAVYLTLYAGANTQAAEAKFNIIAGTSTDVTGIGDKAHWDKIGDTLKVLEVLKGANELSIQVVDSKAGADPEAESTTLVQKALARLP